MVGREVDRVSQAEDGDVVLIRELLVGVTAVVVAGFLTVVLFPGGDPVGRVLVMAVICGVIAAG